MATQFAFGKIVTDGLVLALDAADKNSYPGSGTTWRDLSGNNYHFTLTNSPTFSSHKGIQCFNFDQASDYAVYSGALQQDIGSECTIQIVMSSINNTGFGSCSRLMAAGATSTSGEDYTQYYCFASCDTSRFGVWYNSTTTGIGGFYPTSTLQTSDDSYKMVSYSWSTSNNQMKIHVNGNLENTGTFGTAFNYSLVTRLVLGANNGFGENSYVRIASVLMYNKYLSASEIAQNYNAQKSRFNL
jgi:hypothetical protein